MRRCNETSDKQQEGAVMRTRGHTGNTVVDSKGGEVANARGHGHIAGAVSEAEHNAAGRHTEVEGH